MMKPQKAEGISRSREEVERERMSLQRSTTKFPGKAKRSPQQWKYHNGLGSSLDQCLLVHVCFPDPMDFSTNLIFPRHQFQPSRKFQFHKPIQQVPGLHGSYSTNNQPVPLLPQGPATLASIDRVRGIRLVISIHNFILGINHRVACKPS